ncbi:unnamed protein product [Urochloa humidicola]
MARIGTVHIFVIALLLSAVVCSDSARVLTENPAALPAGDGHGEVAEMTVPGQGQSPGVGAAAAHESKRLSPGGPDPQHH